MLRVLNVRILAVVVGCGLILPAAWSEELHVPGMYETVQAAIDDAQPGDEVVIAIGTYAGPGNKDLDFGGKAITVRSLDPNDPDVVAATVIDCEGAGRGFYFHSGEGPDSVVAGLTITKACASTWGGFGGGVWFQGSSATLSNCTIRQNTAATGGGICSYGSGSPVIARCTITQNTSTGSGGGIYCFGSGNHVFLDCLIARNVAHHSGGGLYCYTNSRPSLMNCTITQNAACRDGGGVCCYTNSGANLVNCTIVRNGATAGGGVCCYYGADPTLTNCVAWTNTPEALFAYSSAEPVVAYSAIEGGWVGEGNIDTNPLLTPDGHLLFASPCRDAGDPAGDHTGETDIDGEPRVVDACVDMGSDEWLDSDVDGLPDWWEQRYFDDPLGADPLGNEDGDGRTNLEEYGAGSNPLVAPRAFHASTAGNDAWDGLASEWDGEHGPKATIQAAINVCHPCEGDKVIVADGVYTGPGNRDLDLWGRAITVRAAGPVSTAIGPPIIDCGGGGRGFYFHCGERADSTVAGLTIRNGHVEQDGAGVCCQFSSPTITNCIIAQNASESGHGGFYCYCCSPTVTNCTLTRNIGSAFSCVSGEPSLTNCIVWNNGVSVSSAGNPLVTYSVVEDGWLGDGNIDTDPLITADGHLGSGSPCYNTGDPNGDYTGQTDVDGEPRVLDGCVDIGADEWLDSDADGLPDWWEQRYFDDPVAADPLGDEDDDGRNNFGEYISGTNPLVGPRQFYVDPAGNDEWDGLAVAWDGEHGPKATIQAAIDACCWSTGDEVVVAKGTYAGVGNKNLDFGGKVITVRSDDPDDPAVVAATVIDCENDGRAFYFDGGEGRDSVVAGLTITGGRVNGNGGGIYCDSSSPTLTNCTVARNTVIEYVDGGAGIYCRYSSPLLVGCRLIENSASRSGGGGIYCAYSDPVLLDCEINGNGCMTGGGGLRCVQSNLTLTDCAIDDNGTGGSAGAIACSQSSSLTLIRCTLSGNSVPVAGGALFCSSSELMLTDCAVTHNTASDYGGAVACVNGTELVLTRCTLGGNSAARGTSLACEPRVQAPPSTVTIRNSVLWSDGEAIRNDDGSTINVTYSDVAGGWEGEGNIDEDPLFVDPENGDFHVSAGSPCIDAGDPGFVPGEGETDMDGQYRVWDGDGDGVAVVDMGADEFGSPGPGDLNCDGVINNFDIRPFILALTNPAGYEQQYPNCNITFGDLNGDGIVNNFDIRPFIDLLTGG